LQSTLAPGRARSGDGRAASLPFALDAIRIYAPTTARMTVRVRRARADGAFKVDLDLAAKTGRCG
jgi:hypothetical protein